MVSGLAGLVDPGVMALPLINEASDSEMDFTGARGLGLWRRWMAIIRLSLSTSLADDFDGASEMAGHGGGPTIVGAE
jgi:hypothetical protein